MRARFVFLSMVSICLAMAQSPGTFTATRNMNVDRFSHTATLLYTGKVLIAGGFGAGAGSAELYDPATGVFTRTGDLLFARRWHTATLLAKRQGPDRRRRPDGRVVQPRNWSI